MVPADSDHVSRAWSYSGYPSVPLFVAYEAVTRYGGPSQTLRLNIRILNEVLQPRRDKSLRFGLFRVRSPLLTESLLLSLPPGNEMFQFPGFARVFRDQCSFDNSPGLFAVFHALTPSSAKTSPTRPY
jgi:hypothetical protein